eukprot:scaffold38589_cov41-Cyclotella_meneghiniana.AAC.3
MAFGSDSSRIPILNYDGGGFPHDDCLDLSMSEHSKINTAYDSLFKAGNASAKWTVSGWYQRSLKEDAASAAGESSSDYKYSKKVASSDITYYSLQHAPGGGACGTRGAAWGLEQKTEPFQGGVTKAPSGTCNFYDRCIVT